MYTQFGILDLGTPQLIIILAIILLLFGGKKLPEMSKALGNSITELRRGMEGDVSTRPKEAEKPQTEA